MDRLVSGIAYEAKAGIDVGLTSSIRLQALKDAELVTTGQVNGVVRYFFQGAQQGLLDYLSGLGIGTVVAP